MSPTNFARPQPTYLLIYALEDDYALKLHPEPRAAPHFLHRLACREEFDEQDLQRMLIAIFALPAPENR